MRITNQMLSRNYLSRMNSNLRNLTSSNEKMASGRKFNNGYENVRDAGKALNIRTLIAGNERYQTTIRDVSGRAAAAEDGIRGTIEILRRSKDRVIEALNGTMAPEDREKIATELSRMQDEVFQIMNSQFSGKFLYAAAGNKEGTAPFTQADNGRLVYNGTMVDSMFKNYETGNPQHYVPDVNGVLVPQDIPFNKKNFVDIGAGFRILPDGNVDPNTAHLDTYSGVECFGYGVNEDGVPNNVYSLLGRMVDTLNNNDMTGLEKTLNAVDDSLEFLLTTVTEVGTRATILDDASARLGNEYENLLSTQNKLEFIDLSQEIIHNKNYEMSWMVTLQLGSKILPQSIFDFIR